ncbi:MULTISPECIES: hypothetical protein [Vibrio]|uniref:Exonuclease V subunit gamma n=1 Tax=Vibrio aestuarianus TaxID=28171 RepID=A0A7X6N4J0_9VIBR|nr:MULTISPECIES: hypothetical protein [Vibrio]MDE1209857.1 hypothetical protein [Vibrio aestuarianus]MDE1212797.1 hypothetical protein [Vibrio aestuarianus]MDE1216115.1 hypothetical protein [Vibrio aestuarianus]MDE1221018.1 hypothetical protein [Vibrio aestuarianus]MDE1223630.1 hypothetical protein [Vibrio aestuarianus]
MKTIICNSLQSFWDMGDHQFLEGHNVHCVFPANNKLRGFILSSQDRYKIKSISFTHAFA